MYKKIRCLNTIETNYILIWFKWPFVNYVSISCQFLLHFTCSKKVPICTCVNLIYLPMDFVKVDALAGWKISKRQFLKDIKNFFVQVSHIGLELHQFVSFWNISTNTVAKDVKSLRQNGLWLAGWLSYGQYFFVKFAKTLNEQPLKSSRRYLILVWVRGHP